MSMPIYVLWNVRISLKRKIQLGALFSLVVITMAVAIVRVVVVSKKDSLSNRKQVEITWLYLWHFIESCVGMYLATTYETGVILTRESNFGGLSRFLSHSFRGERSNRGSRGKGATRKRTARIRTQRKSASGTCKISAGIALQ